MRNKDRKNETIQIISCVSEDVYLNMKLFRNILCDLGKVTYLFCVVGFTQLYKLYYYTLQQC